MLEWVSVYWFSREGPAASLRIYYEMTGGRAHDEYEGTKPTSVPCGTSYFPAEIFWLPKSYVRYMFCSFSTSTPGNTSDV